MPLKEILNKAGKYATLITGGMTIESYFRGRQNDIKDITINTLMQQNNAKENIIKDQLERQIHSDKTVSELSAAAEKFTTNLQKFEESKLAEPSYLEKAISVKAEIAKIIADYTNTGNKSLSGDYLNQLQTAIDNLGQTQKLALIHILASISILFCLFTLIGVYLGDYIIEYFKLEARYPRLARYFSIRRKFQTYYFI